MNILVHTSFYKMGILVILRNYAAQIADPKNFIFDPK